MTRNEICLLTSLVFIAFAFLYSFGALAWAGDQYSANPLNATLLVISYVITTWALCRTTASTDMDGMMATIMWILTIGFSTIAVLGWTAYFRRGLAVGTEYPVAIPGSGAVMIFVSITMVCYCLAAHASRKRTFADSAAVFLVLMGFLLGISMSFVLAHAESIHKRQQRAELLGELNSQIKDAQGFFKSR